MVRFIIAILILGLSGAYSAVLREGHPSKAAVPDLTQLPATIGDWVGIDLPPDPTEVAVLAADTQLERRYLRSDGAEAWLVVAYFSQQRVNSQIHSPVHCVPGEGWSIVSMNHVDIPLADGSQPATRMRVKNARRGGDLELYYWFGTQSGPITGDYALKWDLVKSSLVRVPTNAAFIRYHGKVQDREAILQLMSLLDRPLHQILGQVGLR
jgi:EpsI family protein